MSALTGWGFLKMCQAGDRFVIVSAIAVVGKLLFGYDSGMK